MRWRAVKIGLRFALDLGTDFVVKIDSDGQMSPDLIPDLMKPLLDGKAQLSKGNRFRDPNEIRSLERGCGLPFFYLSPGVQVTGGSNGIAILGLVLAIGAAAGGEVQADLDLHQVIKSFINFF